MDPFDDILPAAPAARGRAGGRFAPKAKSLKQPLRKDILAASEPETSSKDGRNEHVASSLTRKYTEEISQDECGDAALVDALPSTITLSKVESDSNCTDLKKSACEGDLVASEVDPDTNFIPETYLGNGSTEPVQPPNAVENLLSDVALPPTTCSAIGSMEEPPKNGKDSSHDSNKTLELVDNSLQVSLDVGLKSVSDGVARIESNSHSNFNFGRDREADSAEFELDPFSNLLPDPGTKTAHKFQPKIKPRPRVRPKQAIASAPSNVMNGKSAELPTPCTDEVHSLQSCDNGNGGLNQSTNLPVPTSEIPTSTNLSNKFDYMSSSIPSAEDNNDTAAVIPSQMDSSNGMLSVFAVHTGTSFGKSVGENADIFSGLESLDDSLAQAATDTGKKPAHKKGTKGSFVIPACSSFEVCHTNMQPTFVEAAVLTQDDTRANNRRLETEETVDLSAAGPIDDVLDYQSKSGSDPTSEIPVNEEHTEAADSPTLADILQPDVTREKEDANKSKKDGTRLSSLKKRRRSAISSEEDIGGKTSRQLRKQAARKPVNNSVNEEDDDDLDPPYSPNRDELEDNDEEFEVDDSSKKKTNSKKSVDKNGKTSQKRRKVVKDSENTTKDPPKKLSPIASEEDIGGKTSGQLRKQAARKPVNNLVNEEDVGDLDPPYNLNGDELEENDEEFEVDDSSKKKMNSTSSTKKSVAKNRRSSQKRKKVDKDSEITTKEPPKKFSHSSRRKKRCVDKALLDIPEDELDPSTLPLKDIILLAEYRERLAKKEAATAKTSSTNQSGGDSLHETGANSEEEILGSEDGREPGDDQDREYIPMAATLFNYQSFMDKPPRGKWSKQDNELFYEAVRQFGTDFSMIQQLFPDRTRHQIKLKYKKEERQHPLELADAINNRATDHSHFKLVIERLQQASAKAEQDLGMDGSDFMTGEEVEDLAPGANDEAATTQQDEATKQDEVTTTEQEPNFKDEEDSAQEANDDDDQNYDLYIGSGF